MSDIVETLWKEFLVETDEHFQIVEPILVAAESAELDPGDIGQLFRSVHSVKGMARAMGLASMEQVAHLSENLLGLARDGTAALDGETVDLLLTALDSLKELRDVAAGTRADGALPADLVAALDGRFHALTTGETAPAENFDPAYRDAFRELLDEKLPQVARLTLPEGDDETRTAAADDADSLRHACDTMGLAELASVFAKLAELAAAPSADAPARATALLGQVIAVVGPAGLDLLAPDLGDGLGTALAPPSARAVAVHQDSAPPAPRPVASATPTSNVVRVRGETIDQLMTQVGELVTIGNLIHMAAGNSAMTAALAQLRDIAAHSAERDAILACANALQNGILAFVRGDEQLSSVLGRLQDATLELRVVPVETVFSRFPRVVRDIAHTTGKRVQLQLEGTEVRIDKGMLDALVDPLMHMVRNAVDHGIESPEDRAAAGKPATARVVLRALNRNNRAVIEIADDGRGMSVERIREKALAKRLANPADIAAMSESQIFNFIFAPGFSTAEKVTETSGRGVGMDVVQTTVTKLGGSIDVTSVPGEGTTFTLQLPLSAAIQRVLMVEAAGQMIAIPERCLAEIVNARHAEMQVVCNQPALLLRNAYLPVYRLGELLGFGGWGEDPARSSIVVLTNDQHRIGLQVDRLLHRQELFVKEMHPRVAAIPGIGGVSTTGDGRVVIIVDADDLFQLAARFPLAAGHRCGTAALPAA